MIIRYLDPLGRESSLGTRMASQAQGGPPEAASALGLLAVSLQPEILHEPVSQLPCSSSGSQKACRSATNIIKCSPPGRGRSLDHSTAEDNWWIDAVPA